jgi:hypothetical protein
MDGQVPQASHRGEHSFQGADGDQRDQELGFETSTEGVQNLGSGDLKIRKGECPF